MRVDLHMVGCRQFAGGVGVGVFFSFYGRRCVGDRRVNELCSLCVKNEGSNECSSMQHAKFPLSKKQVIRR